MPNAWAYIDSYGVHTNTALVTQHPEWIFRDQNGNKLYIPWGCKNGTCTQYAFDFSNPAYRAWFIAEAKTRLAVGYKGLWVDDVNLQLRTSDGSGTMIRPIDRATNLPMTDIAWERYFAKFMTELREALPKAEILHNSIWYWGQGTVANDVYMQQEIKAANWINRERGVSDKGRTGDGGKWSIQAFFAFVDGVHSLGANIDIQEFDFSGDYGPAAYFLVSNGRDAFGNNAATPDNWPSVL